MAALFSLIIVNCEKIETELDSDVEINSSQLKSAQVYSSSLTNYLFDLISTIETMVEEGVIREGNSNALIVKIQNAIKSIIKTNTKAVGSKKGATINTVAASEGKGTTNGAVGQLTAFIAQVEGFINSGILTIDEGQLLISVAENAIIAVEGSFSDPRDGQVYSVVLIGDQLWMAENLRATKFNDGADIPLVLDDAEWTNLTTPAYSWFQNDESTYGILYGALYNWFAVETGKLSPIGWHVPTNDEFATLVDYLENNGYGYEGSGNDVAKSIASSTGWSISSILGSPGNDQTSNNSSGFSGLPGGLRGGPNDGDGMFYGLGYWAMWWTTSEYINGAAHDFRLRNNGSNPWLNSSYYKEGAEYVRCIKD